MGDLFVARPRNAAAASAGLRCEAQSPALAQSFAAQVAREMNRLGAVLLADVTIGRERRWRAAPEPIRQCRPVGMRARLRPILAASGCDDAGNQKQGERPAAGDLRAPCTGRRW